jgi:ribosomal protein S18 acetylase RimI-like enzyme
LTLPEVKKATPEDVPAMASMLGRAFAHDPMLRWPLRATDEPEHLVAEYFQVLDAGMIELGSTWRVGDIEGMAVWLAPDQIQPFVEIDRRCRPAFAALTPDRGRRYAVLWDWIESMIPDDDLWFLDHLAVDPASQGRGIGSALTRFGLERADGEGRGSFLETGIERNVAYYERFGFRVVAAEDAPDGGPYVWFMRRDPAT